uniref:Uncharacterized protein n=1 Tax=Glossina austeni TaxID=7395 RepID=A0A1A9V0Y9_GLOAU
MFPKHTFKRCANIENIFLYPTPHAALCNTTTKMTRFAFFFFLILSGNCGLVIDLKTEEIATPGITAAIIAALVLKHNFKKLIEDKQADCGIYAFQKHIYTVRGFQYVLA